MVSLNCKAVFGATLGALNTAIGVLGNEPRTKHCADMQQKEKSLPRDVTVNVLSILLRKVSLALHPADRRGQKFRYHSEGAV